MALRAVARVALYVMILTGSMNGHASDAVPEGKSAIKLGVSPWTTPQLLHAWLEPMRIRLEKETGQAFIISSAANHQQYLQKNIAGEFTVAQVPMHMSLYLIKYHNLIPVLFGRAGVKTYIITMKHGDVNSLADLNAYPYLLPDPLAIVSFMTKEALQDNPPKYFQHSNNHWSVLQYLMEGRFKAGSVLSPMYDGLAEPVRKQFKVLYESPYEFDGMYLMPATSSLESRKRIIKTLSGFKPSTKSVVQKIEPVTNNELQYWFKLMGKYADQIHGYMRQASSNTLNNTENPKANFQDSL